MYPNSIYFGLEVVPIWGTLGLMYILYEHMGPEELDLLKSTAGLGYRVWGAVFWVYSVRESVRVLSG